MRTYHLARSSCLERIGNKISTYSFPRSFKFNKHFVEQTETVLAQNEFCLQSEYALLFESGTLENRDLATPNQRPLLVPGGLGPLVYLLIVRKVSFTFPFPWNFDSLTLFPKNLLSSLKQDGVKKRMIIVRYYSF
jgi:hypothetical protein